MTISRLLVVLPLLISVAACGADDIKKVDDPFEVRVGADGKGDGLDGLLSSEDLDRLESAFEEVIAAGEETIEQLELEIAQLESDNQAKAAEIDSLVQQMEQRRRELEDQHDRNLILCALFPNPAICVLSVMIANDDRMQRLERDLGSARSEQTRIRDDIARFEGRRDSLRADLVPLRESKERLIALFRQGVDPRDVPEALEPGSPEAAAFSRADVLARIAEATRAEINVLVEIRNAAAELAGALDEALVTVRALATSVDGLVEDARGQFMDMIEALVSGDPDALARDWLDEALAAKTRELLAALDWPARELVEHLLATRAGDEVDLDALARDLLDKLLEDTSIRLSSAVALSILDNTEAVSVLEVRDDTEPVAVDVTVRIEHTFIGDLRIWLEHDGLELVIHDHTGGDDDDLTATASFELPAGTSGTGPWRLHVADNAAQDTGRLLGWDLVLR